MSDETAAHYRNCFSTGSGRFVLHNILEEAGCFRDLETIEELAVENFAKTILHKLEIYGDVRNNAMVINRMFDIPIRKETGWLKRNLRNLRKLRKQKR